MSTVLEGLVLRALNPLIEPLVTRQPLVVLCEAEGSIKTVPVPAKPAAQKPAPQKQVTSPPKPAAQTKPVAPTPCANKIPAPVLTPRRLLVDPATGKKETKVSEEYAVSSPMPSAWPTEWAIIQVNSNHPIEDRAFISVHPIKKAFLDEKSAPTWVFTAVIDGHSGWQTAEYVQKTLGAKMEKAINGIKEATLSAENIGKALTTCFEGLDAEIKGRIDPAFGMGYSNVAKPGATTCACLISPSKLICANIGDSMAVLSRGGKAIKLNREHNCGVPEEGEKMRRLHPNEPDIVFDRNAAKKAKAEAEAKEAADSETPTSTPWGLLALDANLKNMTGWLRAATLPFSWPLGESHGGSKRAPCYLKGRLQLTRAFGDFYLKDAKYAKDVQQNKYLVDFPHSFPYVVSTPDITVMERESHDEFLIIASDGLWDWVTPEEACQFLRPMMKKGIAATEALDKFKEHLYTKWVEASNSSKESTPPTPYTIEKLKVLTPAERRKKFDDMTIVLVNLRL
eukprot:Blabericola_migrator_1__7698@NODE_392_length_9038_cov_131_832349_g80_i1_p3_GENE_NODE_392_length_9038_cov_131_832349_g80_i1NODE_392_length_9038_cov_131_832349_g80_i1_p3_ORF_typecomplete_len510_score104_84PP2C/PF00481_21/4_9e49PP2C_2/PF13672_6/6_2e16SpoIIE/PF07228_12/0_31SpoIIE/PF07228_12/0_013_NODE_392_length_9038_cov_131_832349_g80_i143815910